MNKKWFILPILLVLCYVFLTWQFSGNFHRTGYSWPLAISLGIVAAIVFVLFLRRFCASKPSPFQLVLRLSNDDGGDEEDDQTFRLLIKRFKQVFPKSNEVRYDGFDTDGSFIWFYFCGPNDCPVYEKVLGQVHGRRIRKGSYFLSMATRSFGSLSDGYAKPLEESQAAQV